MLVAVMNMASVECLPWTSQVNKQIRSYPEPCSVDIVIIGKCMHTHEVSHNQILCTGALLSFSISTFLCVALMYSESNNIPYTGKF